MVVQSFGVRIICIDLILFELCVREKKKKERKKKNKIKIFRVRFSWLWGEVMELWGYILHENSYGFSSIRFLYHFAVFILELLPYLKKGAVTVWCCFYAKFLTPAYYVGSAQLLYNMIAEMFYFLAALKTW